MDEVSAKLKQSFAEFKAVQSKHGKLGAYDTEPDCEFHNAMRYVFLGGDLKVPQTAEEWHLFSDMDGADKAATEMTQAAMRAALLVETHRGETSCKEFLKEALWRVELDDWRASYCRASNLQAEQPLLTEQMEAMIRERAQEWSADYKGPTELEQMNITMTAQDHARAGYEQGLRDVFKKMLEKN